MDGIWFDVDDADVAEGLTKLVLLLSPQGAAAFLGVQVGPYLSKRAGERFAGEGDDVVGQWAPLKESTVGIRESQNFPGEHPINRRTGELENWVVDGGWNAYPTALGGSLQYPKNKPGGELKTKVQTAQKGKEFPRTVPRPVLGVNETDMLFLIGAYQFAIEAALK